MGFEPLFFTIPNSITSFQNNLVPPGEVNIFYEEVSLLFIFAYLYFFVDSLTGLSIGKMISGIRSAIIKKDEMDKSTISILWLCWRAMVKTLPFLFIGDLIIGKWSSSRSPSLKRISVMKILTISLKKEPSTFRVVLLSSIIYFCTI